jgi:molecular chaperone DnaK (HSP70)
MSAPVSSKAVAVGIDLGSFNARVATFDESLGHPVCAHNNDGHRTTRVVLDDSSSDGKFSASSLDRFLQENLIQLASDAAHTKDLSIITSIPNDMVLEESKEWIQVLQNTGGVMTEAAAVCLAYDLEDKAKSNQKILVVDGGASSLKVAILRGINGLWCLESTKKLCSVNGAALVEPLAQSVAQQFETKHRFPRGEVWQSKKARAKLQKACEAGLTTLQINNTLTIHVDGLYEGMDCQATISKAKWDHLSSKLVKDTKDFLEKLPGDVDTVLLSGNMHVWLKPIVQSVFPGRLLSSTIDPAEAIALGCTKQAKWNLSHASQAAGFATVHVPMSPVAIAINKDQIVIEEGTPLPVVVNYDSSESVLEIWQVKPTRKQLAALSDLSNPSTIRMLLSETGKLRIVVGGESIVIGA